MSLTNRNKDGKLFLGLLGTILLIVGVILGGIWYLNLVGINSIGQGILLITALLISIFALIVLLGVLGIIITLKREKPISILYGPTRIVISYLFPLIIYLGKFMGFDKLEIQNSFIQVSNRLVKPERLNIKPDKVLMLLPHCIQKATCKYKVTHDLDNCRRCGQCQIEDILELRDNYGINIAIATGGTLARKLVKELRPKAILAVACERDLASGIQDVYPMPVVGVVNIRPEGPCVNTLVDLNKLEETINKIL
ncbi:DUF116 domain-containing protein [Selenihalanaerobacter shriftii]|uniref:DUF116 domain-containing protein n=1 Tax=Selenihalanaerobacter shriftii TaxID=142842 RepID=A0A1T4JL88_9FIRM|nr:DUF116 domain-containing protein [Selenihalanaerobacter shriftii]SJZ30926.1 hypothetical protein SAMN02745118_00140 [Selenihalanaerobacter shriftii]